MVDSHCIFCRIIGGEEMVSLVHEDDRTLAFLDIQPMSRGHTLIVTKDHYETLFDMPEDLAAHCLAVARRIAPGIQRAMEAQAINIFSANGKAGGQDVPHFHLHLIPVKEGEPFALQLPMPDAPIPSRSARHHWTGQAIQEEAAARRPWHAGGAQAYPVGGGAAASRWPHLFGRGAFCARVRCPCDDTRPTIPPNTSPGSRTRSWSRRVRSGWTRMRRGVASSTRWTR
jgi:histidine triad (HIT) family protein